MARRDLRTATAEGAGTRRGLGMAGRLAIVVLVLVVGGGGVWLITSASTPKQAVAAQDIPALQVVPANVQPGSATPQNVALTEKVTPPVKPQPQAGTGRADPLTKWAQGVAARTDIPARALWAYGNAELVLHSIEPGCHISWATLAGIGRVESNHGRFGGAQIGADGKETKPIVGVPLDGSGAVASVGDTDHGQIDGDPTVDRAVGPMQFIPSTWRKWASDGNGDGRGDAEQIDDAALGAARYLCAGGRHMGSATGWWSGVLSYNNSIEYGQKVFGLADSYARAANQQASGVGR